MLRIGICDDIREEVEKQEKRKYVIIRICQQLYFSDTLFS